MRRLGIWTLAAAVAATFAPLAGGAQDSTAAPRSDRTWQAAIIGLGYGAPNRWFLTLAAFEGGVTSIEGRAVMLEVGQAGTRLGAGYALWAESVGAVARVTALRTYGHPRWAAPNRTMVGPEIRLAVLGSFGVAWLWDVGPRPRSGKPLVAYSISFVL